ncbi:MAG: ribosomal L7Ae/L30e/S12e/Gadd45 family protein [Candidatus Aenigmarchaeota archaeon]|nr:ribosomal L7Ae/L30e/S12e/Gadd45 family protein [Candidatus Aenigmarchaeota archaeon]
MADEKYTSKIKQALAENQVIIGLNKVLMSIKLGGLSDVYYCSNCPKEAVDELNYYKKLSSSLNIESIPLSNSEFGTMCKKQFFISVVGIKK